MKKKYPVFYLFEIPVEIFLYVIVIQLGARLEAYLFGVREDHLVSTIILVIATVFVIAAIISSIVNFVRGTIKKAKKKKAAKESQNKSLQK